MAKARLTILHPNKDGDWSSVRAELFYQNDERPGFVRLSFARQKGDSFDCDGAISCDLKFDALTKTIMILRGDAEQTEPGKPMATSDDVRLALRRKDDGCVVLAAMRKSLGSDEKIGIVLAPHEADGLRLALEQSMFFVAFIKAVNP